MTLALGGLGSVILLVYLLYFLKIIKGNPEVFEAEILQAIANWIIMKGSKTKTQLWSMLIISLIFEIIYFVLVFIIITNPLMLLFTAFFAGVELFHLITVGLNFNKFFKGQLPLKNLLNWKVERLSATLFFTHSLMVIVILIFF